MEATPDRTRESTRDPERAVAPARRADYCARNLRCVMRLLFLSPPARLAFTLLVLFFRTVPAFAQSTNGAHSLEELGAQIEAHVTAPRFNAALWGVQVDSLDTGRTVFAHHADRLMSPASNSKLYMAALALDRLGGDYRFVTPLYATAKPNRAGRVRGDVILFGQGDPSWNLPVGATNFYDLFEPFVAVLTNAGVRRISGDIVADATFFHGPPNGGSWTVEDLENTEGAEVSAITLAENCAQLRITPAAREGEPCRVEWLQPHTGLTLDNRTTTSATNGVRHLETHRSYGETVVRVFGALPLGSEADIEDAPVPRPADWFAAGFKAALARHGIRVDGRARSVRWPEASVVRPTCVKLGEITSPPLRDLVRACLKPSQNLFADLLFDHVGELTRTPATPAWRTSEGLALDALEAFLRTNNLPAGDLHFDEGSGLSRNNLTSARLTLALLELMARHRSANDFANALPIAGVDGTLRRRMKGTPAEGNVRAKTGTLRWANSLSGYVTSAAGERLAFSLMLNRYVPTPDHSGRLELDAIAEMLARLASRSDTTLESLYAPAGRLILASFGSAPFPHPARAAGHTYHDAFYPAATHYADSTVALFVPRGFHETPAVDFVMFVHGWNNSVAGALGKYQLVEQFAASGKNAVLVVPEGPHNAPDSFGGKFEDPGGGRRFFREALATLQARGVLTNAAPVLGRVILAGHSGGYHALAGLLDRGGIAANVKEVWLFDALYGGTDTFQAWQQQQHGRWLNLYTDHGGTRDESLREQAALAQQSVPVLTGEDGTVSSAALETNSVAFLHTDLAHDAVVNQRKAFELFLKTSRLENP